MIIDLRKKAFTNRIRSGIIALVVILAIIAVIGVDVKADDFLGIDKTIFYIVLPSIFIIYMIIIQFIIKPYYIYFNDEGAKIILRFFPMSAFVNKKNAIELPRNVIYKIEVNKKGFKEELVLFIKLKEGVAKYPPINLVAMKKDEKAKLIASLQKVAQVKK